MPQPWRALIEGASIDEIKALKRMLTQRAPPPTPGIDPDTELAPNWREGGYPYRNLLSRKRYERQKYRLQVELLKLQAWVKDTGQRVVDPVRGPRRRRQGRHDQALHGASQSARRARGGARETQ